MNSWMDRSNYDAAEIKEDLHFRVKHEEPTEGCSLPSSRNKTFIWSDLE